jgi:nucleotide-binding universal stress UspA family protein
VPIETRVVHGFPTRVLPRMAADTDLLVVGSRGRGAVAEALLGSVSHGCVHHAPCPVVVVRGGHAGAHGTAV